MTAAVTIRIQQADLPTDQLRELVATLQELSRTLRELPGTRSRR